MSTADEATNDLAPVRALDPLRYPRYRQLWIASMVSGVGTFMQLTAAPWLMLELTGSPLMVSLVTTALLLPQLVLTLPAGVLADVFDRRSILLTGQAVSVTAVSTMAVLAELGRLTPSLLLALTLLLGTGNAIGQPSFQTIVPDLVPSRLRTQAITLTAASFNVSRAIGPSVGGVLVAAGLTSTTFALNAVSYLGIAAVFLRLPRRDVDETRRLTLWRSTATGVRYARFTQQVRTLLLITAAFSLTSASVQALLPAFAEADLEGDATDFGRLYAAFGIGALLAAVSRDRANQVLGRWMLPGVVIGFGLGGILLGRAPNLPLAAAALLLIGTCWVWTVTTLNASVQALAPRWVRGRIVSLFVLTFGFQPIGALIAGLLAERAGAGWAITVLTGSCLALGVGLLRLHLPPLQDLQTPLAGDPDWAAVSHRPSVHGSPIVVASTWRVDPDRIPAFLELMQELRGHRLRTGATRWTLFRDADASETITEMFSVADWEEHLAQHARLDQEALDTIARARSFDRNGSPTSRHLAGINPAEREQPWVEDLDLATHQRLHRTDGSLPLTNDLDDKGPSREGHVP